MTTRKSITTSREAVSCDVCGRTLLRGEHADAFIAGGSRRMVCELCTARAANEGWIREGADNALGVRRNGSRGGRSLLGRLRPHRREAPPPPVELPYRHVSSNVSRIEDDDPPAGAPPGELLDERPAADADQIAAPSSTPARRDELSSGREPRQVHAVPTNADLKCARAIAVFNASAHPRRIAGVTRSLGTPVACVLPSEVEGSIVTIVVGWELCWYRYEVDLADEAAGVRVCGQGAEMSELDEREQLTNAVADERGRLALSA